MKKANGIKLLTLAGLMATAACTGDFLNKNTNPDQATDEMLSWDNLSTGSAFAQMTKNVIPSFRLVGDKEYGSANYQVIEDLAGNIFAGYTGVINTRLHGQQPLQRHGQGLVQRHVQRRLHPRHQRMEPGSIPSAANSPKWSPSPTS